MTRRATAVLHALLVAATLGVLLWSVLGPGPARLPGAPSTVEIRAVDVPRILRMIHENRLSDRDARWWRPAGLPAASPAPAP